MPQSTATLFNKLTCFLGKQNILQRVWLHVPDNRKGATMIIVDPPFGTMNKAAWDSAVFTPEQWKFIIKKCQEDGLVGPAFVVAVYCSGSMRGIVEKGLKLADGVINIQVGTPPCIVCGLCAN